MFIFCTHQNETAGDGDRLLVFLTLFVNQCLKRLETAKSKAEGQKVRVCIIINTRLWVDD